MLSRVPARIFPFYTNISDCVIIYFLSVYHRNIMMYRVELSNFRIQGESELLSHSNRVSNVRIRGDLDGRMIDVENMCLEGSEFISRELIGFSYEATKPLDQLSLNLSIHYDGDRVENGTGRVDLAGLQKYKIQVLHLRTSTNINIATLTFDAVFEPEATVCIVFSDIQIKEPLHTQVFLSYNIVTDHEEPLLTSVSHTDPPGWKFLPPLNVQTTSSELRRNTIRFDVIQNSNRRSLFSFMVPLDRGVENGKEVFSCSGESKGSNSSLNRISVSGVVEINGLPGDVKYKNEDFEFRKKTKIESKALTELQQLRYENENLRSELFSSSRGGNVRQLQSNEFHPNSRQQTLSDASHLINDRSKFISPPVQRETSFKEVADQNSVISLSSANPSDTTIDINGLIVNIGTAGVDFLGHHIPELLVSCGEGCVDEVFSYFRTYDFNTLTCELFTPLHAACIGNPHPSILSKLLSEGFDVNHTSITGDTPLHYLVGNPVTSIECLSILLSAGANPVLYNLVGLSAIHVASLNPSSSVKPLRFLIYQGGDVDINYPTQTGLTCLDICSSETQPEVYQFLLEGGGSFTSR